MPKTEPFDLHLHEYEQWFEDFKFVFLSELEAIRSLIPANGNGLEIGVGSGIFASALGVANGCDPSATMRAKAIERGIRADFGIAEKLPYPDQSFYYALMVTTICFVDDPEQTFREANRVLKPQGELIVAFVDRSSKVGQSYLKHKNESAFYKDARFFDTQDIYSLLQENSFAIHETVQTIFKPLSEINEIEHFENGYGKGSFVVIKAIKK
jgi:ubiquinone/menaquinone biosynthesis C-methylase UbiE